MSAMRPASKRYLCGPLTRDGLAAALAHRRARSGAKLWLLYAYDLGAHGAVTVLPFLDLVLTWNKGISYGLFQQDGALGQWALFGLQGRGGRSCCGSGSPGPTAG